MNDEIDLGYLFRRLWESRIWLLAGLFLPAVSAALLSALFPATYEARAVLLVTQPLIQSADPGNPALRLGGDLNVVARLRSEVSTEAVAALAKTPAVVAEVSRKSGQKADWLDRRMQATVVRGGNLVELKVKASDRETARRIAAIWAEVLVEWSRQAAGAQAHQVYVSLSERVRHAQMTLERADLELKEWMSRSRIGELQALLAKLTEQVASYEIRRNDLDVALARAEAELGRLKEELRRQPAKRVLERTLASEPFLLQVVAENQKGEVHKAAALSLRVEEQNPVYNAVSQSYAVARVNVASLGAEKARVEFRIRRIREEMRRVRRQLAEEQLEETRLRRRVDTARRVYEALVQRREEARIIGASRVGTVEVVVPAATRERPISPKPAFNAAVAGGLGFVVAVFGVLLREAWAGSPKPGGQVGSISAG